VICETRASRRPAVDEIDGDVEEGGSGPIVGVMLLACAAISLAILPSAIAMHAPPVPPDWAAGAVGTLAVVIAAGKVAAMAWGGSSRLWGLHRASVAVANAD
jgi:hypothetical protein